MVQFLLQHGASINGLDEHGNTPLYYACIFGLPGTFKMLISHGADYTAQYSLPRKKTRKNLVISEETEILDAPTVELIQVPARAALDSITMSEGPPVALSRWSPIIVFFIKKGLSPSLDEVVFEDLPALICETRDVEIVQHFLTLHTNQFTMNLGLALSTATSGGKVKIVECLLCSSAEPRQGSMDTASRNRRHRRRFNSARTPVLKTAIVDACNNGRPSASHPSVIDACEPLYKAGLSEADQHTLLAQAARTGDLM